MAKRFDFGGVNLSAGGDDSGGRPSSETPFCIAVLGDFSGRGNRKICDAKTIPKRPLVLVDRDNFDQVLSRFGVEIRLPMGDGAPLHLRFSELDDFHPDRLFQQAEVFGRLRDLRDRLQDPSTFQDAAKEFGLGSQEVAVAEPQPHNPSPVVAPGPARLSSGSLLDGIIEQAESGGSEGRPRHAPDEVREFAQRVAEKYEMRAPDPRQPEVLAVIDCAIGGLMRAVLHNRDFQALEAAWRATYFLVRQLETGSQLKLYLVDISKQELAEDLVSTPDLHDTDLRDKDLRDSGVYRLLVENSVETPGAEPWAVIVGNYEFGTGNQDARLLAKMASIAHRAGAPFIAQGSPRLLGCSSLASAPHPRDWSAPPEHEQVRQWATLRSQPEADAIGLALPRFLLRLPYGKKAAAVESFDFEEFPELPVHDDYLWGNPAFAVALLLGRSFSEAGWEMRAGMAAEIDGLPLHVYGRDGESECKPCAEVLLTEEATERILEEGLIPLVSFKGRDSIRVARIQSTSKPLRMLAGRWGG